ncbi:MAG: sulfatase [Spirochaetes bacterium]|nr:sulfatase [Spirochaetota bacterium]
MFKQKILFITGLIICAAIALTISLNFATNNSYFPNMDLNPVETLTKKNKENKIVFILIDALRPDHLSCYGYERNTSPAIDKIAEEGVTFTNVIANAPWTRPSTASIFTSLHASQHGVQTEKAGLSRNFLTLAEVIKDSDIKTAAVIGNGNASSAWGLDQGFEDYMDTREHWEGLPNAQMVFDLGREWLQKNKDNNFFLTLFAIDPHSPYKSPAEYEELYTDQPRDRIIRRPRWQYKKGENLDPRTVKNTIGLYDGAIKYTDDVIRDFVSELKRLDIYDNTTLIITADHGEGFGEHNRYRHGYHFYDEIIRVPLIIKSPLIKEKGVTYDRLTALIDLYPTILDLYNIPVPAACEGISVFNKNKKANYQHERVIFSEYNNFGLHNQCVRTAKWKLIYEAKADIEVFDSYIKDRSLLPLFLLDKEKYELYNLESDPFEKNNLIRTEKATADKMKANLKLFLSKSKKAVNEVEGEIDPAVMDDLKSLGYTR